MARKAIKIDKDSFKAKVMGVFDHGFLNFSKMMSKDLDKITFDWENSDDNNFQDRTDGTGIEELIPGFWVLWMYAGGDWEYPVFFILYWNGKEIRCYIPKKGNTYNQKTKQAWGNGNDEDTEDVKREDFELMRYDILDRIKLCEQ